MNALMHAIILSSILDIKYINSIIELNDRNNT